MNALFVLFLLASTEAKRRRLKGVDRPTEDFNDPISFGDVYRDPKRNPPQRDDLDSEIEEARKYLNQVNPNRRPFQTPRDEYMSQNDATVQEISKSKRPQMWFDLPAIQMLNIQMADSKRKLEAQATTLPPLVRTDGYDPRRRQQYFKKNSFSLKQFAETEDDYVEKQIINWTTCDEFARGASFHPQDIVDIDWLPFYIWSDGKHVPAAYIHRFSHPTLKLVKEYKTLYGPFLPDKIDWEQPKLFLNESREMLLVALGRTGLFYGIHRMDVPDYLKNQAAKGIKMELPVSTLRLKIEDPYLVMMFCDEDFHYAAVMSINGREPRTDEEKIQEAESIHFVGKGGPTERDLEEEQLEAQLKRRAAADADSRKYVK